MKTTSRSRGSRIAFATTLALIGALFASSSPADAAAPRPYEYHREIGKPYQRLIEKVAFREGVDPKLLMALVESESARDAEVISHAGAVGLAQLMPATAARFGVEDLTDPEENLSGGARYLRWLINHFNGDVALAVAGYNAGEGAVKKHGGIPPYPETRDFVRRVLRKAGLDQKPQRLRTGPSPVRLVRDDDGKIVITNR